MTHLCGTGGLKSRSARAAVAVFAATGLLAVVACAPPLCPTAGSDADAHPALVAQLLFGRGLHGGGEVSDAQWAAFLADSVTPRFPDGLTAVDAAGQWRDPASGRIERERSKLLLLIAADTPQTRARLEELREVYRARFGQDSVGLVTAAGCAAF